VRTGILGGTFDPIHIAHLHTAECARFQLELDRVLIIPAGDPWQKMDRVVSPARHRFEMCRLAVEGVDGIEADDREVVRDGPTYTIDTLDSFPRDEEVFLIVGADAAAGLPSWHRWEEVARRVTIAVAPRPGVKSIDIAGAVRIDMGTLEVSGTDIRERAREGRPYRYLVTSVVHEYIEANDLYAKAPEDDMVGGLNRTEDSS
jgi:nicotinate-nucleotide adenylyltransferase